MVSQTGNYILQTVKGSCIGSSNSVNISITNLNLPAPQILQNYPNDFETCENNVIKLKVKDYTDGSLTWLKDGNVLVGQTSTELIAKESGNYSVRYQGNELCFSQSAVMTVKITDVALMSFAGNDYTVASGQIAAIGYTFIGAGSIVLNINNQSDVLINNPFYKNSVQFYPTATNTYTATNIANACGIGTFSNPAIITVGNCSPATRIQSYSNLFPSVCIGGSTNSSVSAVGSGTLTYQWQKNGVNISGATNNNLTLSNFSYSDIANYSVTVTGGCGTVISSQTIQVNANYGDVVFAKLDYPAYTNSDILLTAFSGSSFGNASNAYRWTGPNGFTSKEQNPIIPNGTALNSGTYTVTATNAGGCVNYALLSVTVTTAPITLGNLGTTSFCPNGTLSISFTTTLAIGTLYKVYLSDANGSFRNQTEIGNGMTSPIDITFPQYAQAGTKYRIRIVSTSPSATSSLSGYLSTDGQALTISVKNLVGRENYGGSTVICQGSAITEIISTNQSGITYEWKKDGVFQNNNSSLRMTQAGNYVASVQKTGCGNISRSLDISFRSSVNYSISRFGDEFQCLGTSILFKNSYYSDSVTYQWKKDGVILMGETKDSIIVNQTGVYRPDITDKCSVNYYATGDDSQVIFSSTIRSSIFGASSKTSTEIVCGNDIFTEMYFFANDNPLAPYSFQWKKNNVNIPNATRYYLSNVKDVGLYTLALSQGNCTVNSNGINVIKKDTFKLKLAVYFPSKEEICQGTSTYLSYDNLAGLSRVLYKDGNITNQNFNVSETGKYVLTGSASGCVVLPSDTVKITVSDRMTFFINNNNPSDLCLGKIASLEVLNTFSSLPNINYQWFKNNQPIPNATSYLLQPNQTGFYKVRATSGGCTGFSDSLYISVKTVLGKPIFADQLSNKVNLCGNNLIRFGINAIRPNNLLNFDSLYIKKDGVIILKQHFFQSLSITQSGTYTLIGKQGTCLSEESDPVEIKIGEPITANITGSTSIYPGQKAKLNLNFTGGNAWSYQTSDVATGQTTTLSPTLKNVSPSNTQTYAITSVTSNCGVGTVTGNATVTVLPCPIGQTISVDSGNWNTSTTWTCGQIPTAAYDAIIENGHTVTLPNGYQGITKKLDLRGGLKQGVGASIKVNN